MDGIDVRVMQPPPPPAGWMIISEGDGPFITRWANGKYPNPWRRFWMWELLGWRFEKNEEAG